MTGSEEHELQELRAELDEHRSEAYRLSEEVNRLRQREQSLDAENQILKSKLLQAEPNSNQDYLTTASKLSAPPVS